MPEERARDGGSGLLGHRGLGGGPRVFTVAQYGELREKLLAYASDRVGQHHPAWAAFDRRVRGSKGGVGIRHETYIVPAGSCELLHIDTPPAGLGAARGGEPVGRRGETGGAATGERPRSVPPLSPPGPDPADGGAGTGVQSRYGFDRRRSTQPVATTPAPTRAAPTPSVSGP
ncbi:DUF4188 domain-containing protein [Streptomyces sp. NPDC029006]|uniref:monooxygenase family protein n=1 Tax=Streptomyces sp. NPDC029006 TaxID=3155467 RepID=UPI0033E4DACB